MFFNTISCYLIALLVLIQLIPNVFEIYFDFEVKSQLRYTWGNNGVFVLNSYSTIHIKGQYSIIEQMFCFLKSKTQ